MLLYLGTFPNRDSGARCRLSTCTCADTVFVVLRWRRIAVLRLCSLHAGELVRALEAGEIDTKRIDRPLTHGEHVPQNFTYPVLGCDRVVPVLQQGPGTGGKIGT